MKINVRSKSPLTVTHEGAPAASVSAVEKLRRSVLATLLWEDQFYEDGQSISDRIVFAASSNEVSGEAVAQLAVEARNVQKLRHVPLLLALVLAKKAPALVANVLENIIQRPDELTEFLALYWKNGKVPLSKQVKRGLGLAFAKFDAYQLAKYDRQGLVRLRDVLRLVHPKPQSVEQSEMWKQLIAGELPSPQTWEVLLSSGADKKETFTSLLMEKKLGYLALLRNLRNMNQSGVDEKLVKAAIEEGRGADKVLPFRFVAAARNAPNYAKALDKALVNMLDGMPKFTGVTAVLVDVSGSMFSPLSSKSDMKRSDAAATLAMIFPGQKKVYSFSNALVEVKSARGLNGIEQILSSQMHAGTDLGGALKKLYAIGGFSRLIVITDEQSHTRVPSPPDKVKGYMINVASARNGVGYGDWNHIDGFSENVLRWIKALEDEQS